MRMIWRHLLGGCRSVAKRCGCCTHMQPQVSLTELAPQPVIGHNGAPARRATTHFGAPSRPSLEPGKLRRVERGCLECVKGRIVTTMRSAGAVMDNVLTGEAAIRSPSAGRLDGSGEMARLVQSLDWASTPLGAPAAWQQSLRSALSICLGSRFPIVIYWGPDLVVLYNDAYAEILGKKHPSALGRPCREVWSEIWDVIGPMLDRVLTLGDATWSEDQLLILERRGYPEECYFSFSFSPVRGANGAVDGIFTAVIENTIRVLGERRLRTLRDLGASLAGATSAEEACSVAADVLAQNRADVPFALFYLTDPQTRRGNLVATTEGENGVAAAPASFELDRLENAGVWPLASVCRSGAMAGVGSPSSVLVLPLVAAGETNCAGIVVVGVSSHRELDQEYKGFFELISRRLAAAIAEASAYEAERQRAEALAEIDRAKTAFFSNVSHEFRTPLTLMLGPLEELLRNPSLDQSERENISTAHSNALRLLKLVNSLLDFARVEAGRAQANYQPTELAAFTVELASSFESLCRRAGLELAIDCPPLSQAVYVDRDMWEKIVLNLLSNAFKFTFEGRIFLALREDGGTAALTVSDTGTGIPEAELPRLFERFHRVEGVIGRTHEGSGIGLALVKEIVRLHGGTVEVQSTEGRGSSFTVRIPFGTAHLPRASMGGPRAPASTATSIPKPSSPKPRVGYPQSRMPTGSTRSILSKPVQHRPIGHASWSPTTTQTCAAISDAFSRHTMKSKLPKTAKPR